MASRRHFTGRPVAQGQEDTDSSESDSQEDRTDDESVQQPYANDEKLEKKQTRQIGQKSKRPDPFKTSGPAEPSEEETEEVHSADGSGNSGSSAESSGETGSDGEESDSDSDSGTLMTLQKPLFLSKKQRMEQKETPQTKEARDHERAVKTIQMYKQQDEDAQRLLNDKELNLGGIDDTDGLDPEMELRLFQQRKAFREQRDRAKHEKEQEELEELELRRLRTEEERDEEFKARQKEESNSESTGIKTKGAFFHEEGLRGRKLEGESEKYDKSLLPQRYDPKGR
jgi:microfibrillar-associated protein 1